MRTLVIGAGPTDMVDILVLYREIRGLRHIGNVGQANTVQIDLERSLVERNGQMVPAVGIYGQCGITVGISTGIGVIGPLYGRIIVIIDL